VAIVAQGRTSGAIPSISSGRSRGRRDRRRRGRRLPGAPLSSLGALLRTRCPQYGHSVTYGLTSDPQFLQTTKRSGCDTVFSEYPAALGYSRGTSTDSGREATRISPTTSRRSWFASYTTI